MTHTAARREVGLFGGCFWLFLRWLGWCGFGGVVALLVTILGLLWLGPLIGLSFVQHLVVEECWLCQQSLTHWVFLWEPMKFVLSLAQMLFQESQVRGEGLVMFAPLHTATAYLSHSAFIAAKITSFSNCLLIYWQAVLLTCALLLLRFFLALHELPLFFLLGAVGFIDGLVLRDLRRLGGGRESALFYHQIKKYLSASFNGAFFLLLIIPWSIKPDVFFLPLALCFAMTLALTVKTFKKYL